MLPQDTCLDPDLVAAYRRAHYLVRAPEAFTLRVGEASAALARLHAAHGVRQSAFVTACNPLGEALDAPENARRHAELGSTLEAMGLPRVAGEGRDPQGAWPAEESWLVLGLGRPGARSLGHTLAQNAVVFCGADATPELVLLR